MLPKEDLSKGCMLGATLPKEDPSKEAMLPKEDLSKWCMLRATLPKEDPSKGGMLPSKGVAFPSIKGLQISARQDQPSARKS